MRSSIGSGWLIPGASDRQMRSGERERRFVEQAASLFRESDVTGKLPVATSCCGNAGCYKGDGSPDGGRAMSAQQEPSNRRASFLPVMLGSVAGVFFLLVLVLVTGGFFLYIMAFFAAVASLACFHWLVWGKLLTEWTAGEREEEELLERARDEEEEQRFTYRR
jgi:hypothetical protein